MSHLGRLFRHRLLPAALAGLLAGTAASAANLLVNGDFAIGNAPGGFDVATNDCPGWRNAGSTYLDTGVSGGHPWCDGGDSGGYQISTYALQAGDRIILTWSANSSYGASVQTVSLLAAQATNTPYASTTTLLSTNASLGGSATQYTLTYTVKPADVGKFIGVFFANTGAAGTYAAFDGFNLLAGTSGFISGADMSLLTYFETNGIFYLNSGVPSSGKSGMLVNGDFATGNARGGYDVATNDCPGWRNAGSTYVDTGVGGGSTWCDGGDSGGYQISAYALQSGDRIVLTWAAYSSYGASVQTVSLLSATATNTPCASTTTLVATNASLTASATQYMLTYTVQPADVGKFIGVFFANSGAAGTYAKFDNFILAQDALQILKNQGVNCIRLRLFTSSQSQAQSDPYNYINNTNYTIPLAARVKNAGLKLLLDFHYSDTWADPKQQATPSAWTSLTFPQLTNQMRSYNSNCIAAFKNAGALPDYVQIGNEITPGMLWTNGQLSGTWNSSNPSWIRLGQLMTAAVQGIQDASTALGTTMPKIIVHIDKGGSWSTTQAFFDNLNAQGVPFDIIGESYYPWWQGSPTNLSICLSNAAVRYGKPVVVAEVAFPFTNTCPSSWLTNLFGYPPTPAGQASLVTTVGQILKNVPNGLGGGMFYWGTEYQTLSGPANNSGFQTASFFDRNGNLLPVASALGQFTAPVILSATIASNQLQIQWPLSGTGMQLTTATNLLSASWIAVTNAVQTTNNSYYISLLVTNDVNRFYRLQGN